MRTDTFHFDIITPCFCGGAEPGKQAEIRAPSIRGQLRWWFRTLGGFKSLAGSGMTVRQQEDMIFGTVAGGEGRAGKLLVRVSGLEPSRDVVSDSEMNARPGSERGYLLFPLRPERPVQPQERRRDRGVFNKGFVDGAGTPSFSLHAVWRGDPRIVGDVRNLVAVLGHLGSLGFRGRRAMGALASRAATQSLAAALQSFQNPESLSIRSLPCRGPEDAVSVLAKWLRSWRSYGRTGKNQAEQHMPGYNFAKNDHDIAAGNVPGEAFRPALGLPILTKYQNWHDAYDRAKLRSNPGYKGEGRFASPILLRPHRAPDGRWHALVIFLESHKWPEGKPVYLNGRPRPVSLALYEAMKGDEALRPYP